MPRFLAFGLILLMSNVALAASPSKQPAGLADLPLLLRRADTNFLTRNWNRAASEYQRIVQLNPTNGLYWHRLGEALLNAKRYNAAIAPLEQSCALGGFQPSPPRWVHRGEAAYLLASAYAGLENHDKAIEWTHKSLSQGLRNIRKFHISRFDELLKDPQFQELVCAGVDDVDELSRDERFRRDLHFAIHELKRVHFSPFRATPEQEIDRAAAELDRDIPKLSDDEIYVRMMGIIRLFGDAHTRMLRETPLLPVEFFVYPEGLYILGATSENADLVGARVLSIGNQSAEDLLTRVMAIVPVENPMTEKWQADGALRSLTVLRGLGVTPPDGPTAVEVEDAAGERRTVHLSPRDEGPRRARMQFTVPGCTKPVPNCFRNRSQMMWHELLPAGKTMYCQLNGIGHGTKTFKNYFEALFTEVEEPGVERLVLDLRWNNGGNTFLNPPLIEGILRSNKFRRPGNLFVIIGRDTFSAALNTTDELERRTTAILVGEPTSSPPNFVGESVQVVLPASRWPISISDLSWQTSFPMDYRVWMTPLLYAPPTAAAQRAHRDPAMEAIEAYVRANPVKSAG